LLVDMEGPLIPAPISRQTLPTYAHVHDG
jgi:hypothetical protein